LIAFFVFDEIAGGASFFVKFFLAKLAFFCNVFFGDVMVVFSDANFQLCQKPGIFAQPDMGQLMATRARTCDYPL
jgi:hypothetical protein